jgi:hypothetical protein
MEKMAPGLEGMEEYKQTVRPITQASNAILFEVMDQLLEAARSADAAAEQLPKDATSWTIDKLKVRKQEFLEILLTQRNAFVGRHQPALLDWLRILPLEPLTAQPVAKRGSAMSA